MGPIRRWRIAPLVSPLRASSFSLLVQRKGTRAAARNKGSIERTLETKHNPRIRSGSSIADRDRQRVAHISARSPNRRSRSEEHTSELQSLMRNSYAVFCLKKKK